MKLSQASYIKKVLVKFNISDAKSIKTTLASHFKLSKEQSPKNDDELKRMSKVPYASAVDSLIYAMIYTRSDITHAVGAVS